MYFNTSDTSMSLCLLKNIFTRHIKKEQQHTSVLILDDLTLQGICYEKHMRVLHLEYTD